MKKYKSDDGYDIYSIDKENKEFFLVDINNCAKEIEKVLLQLDDLKFDSIIIIFGIDNGEYIDDLKEIICEKNKVLIIEPNEDIFKENEKNIYSANMKLILYEDNLLTKIIGQLITNDTFDNLYLCDFGNYKNIYSAEYKNLIKKIDAEYYLRSGNISLNFNAKYDFIKNFISNLSSINNSIPLNPYINSNLNVPAIVVSAGPSLEQNIKDMINNREKLDKCFIIASNRTVDVLVKNNIIPDAIVAIDADDAIYDMMKNNLKLDSPLIFYEYTNKLIVKYYEGPKIYIASILSKTIDRFNKFKDLPGGGTVAYTCISIANMLGCSPIILAGQDLAYTFNKHHADSAIFNFDKTQDYIANIGTIDVYGNEIKTTVTLNMFKEAIENLIKVVTNTRDVQFINVSYGADIKYAPHKELRDIFKMNIFKDNKMELTKQRKIVLDAKSIINSIIGFIDFYINEANEGEKKCEELIAIKDEKSLVNIENDDKDLKKFLECLGVVDGFESSAERFCLSGYFNIFLYRIKRESFNMLAKDYNNLTSDMKYQSRCLLNYFKHMSFMLTEVKEVITATVTEFY